jgi:hypothetical protein
MSRMTPKTGQRAKKGYATYPQKKWDAPRCRMCAGFGYYLERGVNVPCSCKDETK